MLSSRSPDELNKISVDGSNKFKLQIENYMYSRPKHLSVRQMHDKTFNQKWPLVLKLSNSKNFAMRYNPLMFEFSFSYS